MNMTYAEVSLSEHPRPFGVPSSLPEYSPLVPHRGLDDGHLFAIGLGIDLHIYDVPAAQRVRNEFGRVVRPFHQLNRTGDRSLKVLDGLTVPSNREAHLTFIHHEHYSARLGVNYAVAGAHTGHILENGHQSKFFLRKFDFVGQNFESLALSNHTVFGTALNLLGNTLLVRHPQQLIHIGIPRRPYGKNLHRMSDAGQSTQDDGRIIE